MTSGHICVPSDVLGARCLSTERERERCSFGAKGGLHPLPGNDQLLLVLPLH